MGTTAGSLVGRGHELTTLGGALEEAAAGGRSLTLLTGEAGIGKTALARAHAQRAGEAGFAVLWGACFEGGWQAPFGPWVDALAAGGERVAAASAPLPSPEARLRVFHQVREAVRRVSAACPALLVLDDLHWAAADALDLLVFIASQPRPGRLALVCTCRDPDPALAQEPRLVDALARLPRTDGFAHLRLGGLDVPAVGEYLSRRYAHPLPQEVVRAVRDLAAGNPFYIREVIAHLVEVGRLRDVGGRWSTDWSLEQLTVPDTVRRVVRARSARLPPATQALLAAASVLTGAFDLALVGRAADLAPADAVDAIDAALEAGLLVATRDRVAPYAFAHAIVRMALAEDANPDRRAAAHRRIAEAAEALTPGGHAFIAEHYAASPGLPGAQRGVAHCLAAADEAERAGGHLAAVRWLAVALDLLRPDSAPARRGELQARLAAAQADALLSADAPVTALAAGALLPAEAAAALLHRVAVTLRLAAPPTVWQPLVEEALRRRGDTRDALWARLALLHDPVEGVGRGPVFAGRWTGYPAQVRALLAGGDEDDEAALFEPFAVRSPEETATALDRARQWSSPVARMRLLDLTGRDYSLRHARPAAALACYEELLALGERVGSIPNQAEACAQLAFCHALLGDVVEAEAHLARAGALVATLWPGHRLHLLGTASHGTIIGYTIGAADWERHARALEALVRSPAAARAPWAIVMIALAALAHAFAGARKAAADLLAELAPLLACLEPHDHAVPGAIWYGAAAAWELRDASCAGDLLALVARQEGAGAPPGPVPTLDLAAARLLALRDDGAAAHARFAAARTAAEAAGLRPYRALADYDDAALGGPGAGRLASAARGAFERLGMRGWHERATQVSGSPARGPAGLTPREVEVLALLARGATSKEIAARLVLSVATVNRHIANAYLRIGVRNRAEATAWALGHDVAPAQF